MRIHSKALRFVGAQRATNYFRPDEALLWHCKRGAAVRLVDHDRLFAHLVPTCFKQLHIPLDYPIKGVGQRDCAGFLIIADQHYAV